MYPNHYFYHHPYDQTSYVHSTPFQTEHYIPEVYDQRIFPMFPSQGGPMGHHRTTWNRRTESRIPIWTAKLTTTNICSGSIHNNKLALLQWILAALEDVYSDIRMCG